MNELRVLISAAEASSDVHGAELLMALKRLGNERGFSVRAQGIGGPRLQAAGLETVFDARELLSMGFLEVIVRLPRILKGLSLIAAAAARFRPDVAVVIDYPDFHFRLARKLGKLGVPMVYYIPPKVWVWRTGRVKRLREGFKKVLGIFPFETTFFRGHGVPFEYVGNPLLDELPLSLPRDEARTRLGLSASDRVLLLMPGSRPAELSFHLDVMLDGAALCAERIGSKLQVLMPLPHTANVDALKARVEAWRGRSSRAALLTVHVSQGDAATAMRAADAGLVKSGTSTLEAAVLGCPHAVVYRTGRLSAWLFRHVVRYKGPVGLVNLVAAWNPEFPDFHRSVEAPRAAREILLNDVTVENLAQEAFRLLGDSAYRSAQVRELDQVRKKLTGNGDSQSPSLRAALEVLSVGRKGGAGSP